MPKPVYIICAERAVVDQETNLVSFFNVIDKLDVALWPSDAVAPPQKKIAILGAKAVASWSKVKGDEGKKFEAEMLFNAPNGQLATSGVMPFEFGENMFQRFIMTISGIPPMVENGILEVTCRIRRKGSRTWMSQSVEIPVDVTVHGKNELPKIKKTNGKR